jgi:FtsZ-binding cell division protein ZapB
MHESILENLALYQSQLDEKLDKALENLKLTYLEISEYYDDETKLVDKLTELRKISTQLREILDTQNKGGSSL